MNPTPWMVDDVLTATGGQLHCGDRSHRFSGVGIDSRRINAGELFVAIRGDVHDGHDFTAEALARGARGILADRQGLQKLPLSKIAEKDAVCVVMDNTTRGLGKLAAYNRRRSSVSVVAITGSNGKTSTREMTASVLSQRFETLTPPGNYNNEIGLPLTLLSLGPDHRWAVLELGMNHPGEIRRLGEICAPEIGVVTNVGPAHLEGVGTIEGVAAAKAEIFEALEQNGTAVLNADDPHVARMAAVIKGRVIRFGFSPQADIRASDATSDGRTTVFDLSAPDGSVRVRLKTPGRFMILNALAAAAVGHCLGLGLETVKAGLERFGGVARRLNIFSLARGVRVIDDTYNANPGSMAVAIDTLTALCGANRAILVAGDMLELGDHAAALHRATGAKAARSGIAALYVTGEFAPSVVQGAEEGGMDPSRICIGSREQILETLIEALQPGDCLLVKGSRGMRMEKIVEELKNRHGLENGEAQTGSRTA